MSSFNVEPVSGSDLDLNQRNELARAAASALLVPTEEELPANVSSPEQVKTLPPEVLSGDPLRPLLFIDERGDSYKYHLQPMKYSVMFILIVELLERFSFYGINYTQTSYLTGAYNDDWSAEMQAVQAASYVSVSVAMAFTFPFAGAVLADSFLGDYNSILVGSLCFYLPGLALIASTTVPGLLGDEFNTKALAFGLICLWPIGTGLVKSVVNVFGAKQFHPLLQASLIETYYVNFYMCINIGALAGGVVVPLVAQRNVTVAYCIPAVMLTLGVASFLSGTKRFVRPKPRHDFFQTPAKKKLPYNPHAFASSTSNTSASSSSSSWTVLRISLLVIPFNIAYAQMATTFIVQGTVMEKVFGFIDAASMNNADALSVLFFGYVIGNVVYPFLAERDIRIPTTYKFAIGSLLGTGAIAWALVVEYMIHREYQATGQKVSIAWQAVSYMLIGAGEIFAVSAAYEVAFTASPPESKAFASAINLFCVGGLPNFLCIGLYHACARWFKNSSGTSKISDLRHYSQAQVYNYFWVLFLIALMGVVVNLLPPVRDWVASIEDEAANALKTPATTPRHTRPIRNKLSSEDLDDEETALLKVKQHQNYLKYGSGPTLYKNASFRAGVLLAKNVKQKKRKPSKYIKYPQGLTLYKPSKGSGLIQPMVRTEKEAQTIRDPPSLPPKETVEDKDRAESASTL